jgi:hypothetical protein
MLTFVCWRWRPTPGYRSTFAPETVTALRDMIARHYQRPHRFLCITDEPAAIDPGIWTMPLWPDHADLPNPSGRHNPSCYRRLKLFAPGARAIFGERVVSIDLDTVIVADIAPLVDRDEDFVIWGQADFPRQWYNGSFWLLRTGTRDQVWTAFDPQRSPQLAARAGKRGSDQGWISYILGPHEATWSTADGVYSHRVHLEPAGNVLPANARIVFWHGKLDPWDARAQAIPWVREHYYGLPV